jgi:hypothetical protein
VLQSAFRTVIEWLRQRSRAQRSLTAKRSTLLCAGAKSSTHEWPRTARHGADHVCPGPTHTGSHLFGLAYARSETRRYRNTSAPVNNEKKSLVWRVLARSWLLQTYRIEKYIRYIQRETTNIISREPRVRLKVALIRPMDELRLLLHLVSWKSLSSD